MIAKAIALILALCGMYAQRGIITEINRPEDTVRVVTEDGNIWEFYGAEDWDVCDTVELIMDENDTENPEDDVILRVVYKG